MYWDLLKKGLRQPDRIPGYLNRRAPPLLRQFYNIMTFGAKTFQFQGNAYHYYCHRYNFTWTNERAVEVPIVWGIVKKHRGKILEVGNVLSHYFPAAHDIVDKYEKGKGVINVDVVDFKPRKPYDLVVSISTMEHVGWDEVPREPEKILSAIKNIQTNCIAPGGMVVITCPLGANPELDRLLNEGKDQLGKKYFLRRISKENEWVEADRSGVRDAKYNDPFPCASAIVIGFFHKE